MGACGTQYKDSRCMNGSNSTRPFITQVPTPIPDKWRMLSELQTIAQTKAQLLV